MMLRFKLFQRSSRAGLDALPLPEPFWVAGSCVSLLAGDGRAKVSGKFLSANELQKSELKQQEDIMIEKLEYHTAIFVENATILKEREQRQL